MTTYEKRDLVRIKKYLKPLYNIEKIEDAGYIEAKETRYHVFHCYLRHANTRVVTEHLVFMHGKCVDMLSKTAQVKDFGQEDDLDFITVGDKTAPILDVYKNGEEFNQNTILVYGDYVSLREHFFEEDKIVECVQWLRNDSVAQALNWGHYGRYVMTVISCE